MTKSRFENALYYQKRGTGLLAFIVTCQVDNYIHTGTAEEIARFESLMKSIFEVGELKRNNADVYGAEVRQLDDKSISLSQDTKMDGLAAVPVKKDEKTDSNLPATPAEIRNFSGAVGYMLS